MHKVFIMGACRTPIGKMGGALSSIKAVEPLPPAADAQEDGKRKEAWSEDR